MSDEFDVQRRSPNTMEGQIEAAGHFTRGVPSRYGAERVRRAVGIISLVTRGALATFM